MAASTKRSNARRAAFNKPEPQALRLVANDASAPNNRVPTQKPIVLKAQNPTQRFYIKELETGDSSFVFATGPAGTGKTYIAVCHMIQQYREGNIKKMILSRPNVGAGDDLGFMPGSLIEKMAPWTRPLLDVFAEFYSTYEIEKMLKEETLEIAPLVFCRGRTFKRALIVLDEAQNCSVEQMQMFLTRIGEGSRMIVTGDTRQHDRGTGVSGLADILAKLDRRREAAGDPEEPGKIGNFNCFKFTDRDVVRHHAIGQVLDLYS